MTQQELFDAARAGGDFKLPEVRIRTAYIRSNCALCGLATIHAPHHEVEAFTDFKRPDGSTEEAPVCGTCRDASSEELRARIAGFCTDLHKVKEA